jgi:5-(carboxyamino)imidazole ribonucleotide mutase
VSIGNARNAGLLAVRILAAHDEKLRAKMIEFQENLADLARAKGSTVRDGAAELRQN